MKSTSKDFKKLKFHQLSSNPFDLGLEIPASTIPSCSNLIMEVDKPIELKISTEKIEKINEKPPAPKITVAKRKRTNENICKVKSFFFHLISIKWEKITSKKKFPKLLHPSLLSELK